MRETGRRLIEQQQARARRERSGDLDALERSVRESDGRPRHEMLERETLQDRARFGAPLGIDPAVRVSPHQHVLHHRQCREQREVLERPRDPDPRDAMRGQAEQVVAVELDRAARGLVQATHTVEQRRLARTVRSDERADLTVFDREGKIRERDDAAEHDPDILDRQQRHRHPPGKTGS